MKSVVSSLDAILRERETKQDRKQESQPASQPASQPFIQKILSWELIETGLVLLGSGDTMVKKTVFILT